MRERLIVGLDVETRREAEAVVSELEGTVSFYKIGYQLAFAGGLPALTPGLLTGALALGAISAVCHFLTVAAYQRAEATMLAPFLYFNLLTAMTVGFLWFGETLSWTSIVGLLSIAAGGLVTLMDPERLAVRLPAVRLPVVALRPRLA